METKPYNANPEPPSDSPSSSPRRVAAALLIIFSILPAFLGSAWIYTFVFTDYRSHRRGMGILIAFFTLAFAVGLIKLAIMLWHGRRKA